MSATTPQPASANFGFLGRHDRELARLPALAELYCHRDPNTALLKLRQLEAALEEAIRRGEVERLGSSRVQKAQAGVAQ